MIKPFLGKNHHKKRSPVNAKTYFKGIVCFFESVRIIRCKTLTAPARPRRPALVEAECKQKKSMTT